MRIFKKKKSSMLMSIRNDLNKLNKSIKSALGINKLICKYWLVAVLLPGEEKKKIFFNMEINY